MAEAGIADFEAISWFGLLAPVGTPPAVIAKLHQAAVRIVSQPDMRENFELAPGSDTPRDLVQCSLGAAWATALPLQLQRPDHGELAPGLW